MMLSIMTFGLHVDAATFKPTISVDQVTVVDEDSIEVPVRIVNNKGLLGVTITIAYDHTLTLTDVKAGTAFSSLIMTKPGDLSEKRIKILWDGIEADATNGVIAVLTFKKPLKSGTYPIEVSYEKGDIIDGNLQVVEVEMNNGSIMLMGASDEENLCANNGHKGGKATCVKKAICSVCGKEYGEVDSSRHEGQTEIRNAKTETCEESGYTGDTYCKECGKIIKSGTKIKAKGHIEKTDMAVEPTCTINGKTAGSHCSVCGQVIVTQKIIPATGHKGEWRQTKKADVLTKGEYTRICTVCGYKEIKKTVTLTPCIKLNAKILPLQLKKSTNVLKVVKMQKGDSVVSYKSSNPKVVAVNARTGKIIAKKTGKAVITITLRSGIKANCTIMVQKHKVTTKAINVGVKKLVLKRGTKRTIPIVLNPLTSTEKIKVTSSNKKVITVTNKGTVKAIRKGVARITIQSGKKKVVCKITVK